MGNPQHVVVITDTTILQSIKDIGDRAEQRYKTHAKSTELSADITVIRGTDELAGAVYRQRCDVPIEPPRAAVLKQILFHIGKIEG